MGGLGLGYGPRPNVPGFKIKSISGRTLTLTASYDQGDQAVAATHVTPYLYTEAGVLDATGTAVALAGDPLEAKDITVTATADGWYEALVTATDGSWASTNTTRLAAVWLGTAAPSAPAVLDLQEIA